MLVSTYLQERIMKARKPAADRKSEIVAAVLVLADRIGPDRLTTNDVAQQVGLTQAAIFRHFPTKADLWAAVGDTLTDRLTQSWDAVLGDTLPPRERLRALVIAQFSQIAACPALPSILHSRELNVDNPALRNAVQGLLMRFQTHLIDTLKDMAQAGEIAENMPPEDAAVFLTSLIQGLAIRWSLGVRTFDLVTEGTRLLDVQLSCMTSVD